MNDSTREEILEAWLNDELTEGQVAELQGWLLDHRENRRQFVELNVRDQLLREVAKAEAGLESLEEPEKVIFRFPDWSWIPAAAAAALIVMLGIKPARGMTGLDFMPELLGRPFDGREQVFAERGWHFGPITRSDGFDLSRSVTTKRHNFIYNAIPERSYAPVDMASKNIAWDAIKLARENGRLSAIHERIYFTGIP